MAGRARHQADNDGRADRAREVGLFRYALIREAADPALSTKARGRLVRDLAQREHTGPSGERVQISRVTLDRWILDVAPRGLRRAAALNPQLRPEVVRGGAGAGDRVEARSPGPDGGAGQRDPASPRRSGKLGAVGADAAAALREPGAQHPPGRLAAAAVRPVRGRRSERPVDRRCPPRPGGRPTQDWLKQRAGIDRELDQGVVVERDKSSSTNPAGCWGSPRRTQRSRAGYRCAAASHPREFSGSWGS